MPALFSRRADTVFRLVLAGALGTPVIGLAGLMILARSPLATRQDEPVRQALQFDHRHHAGDEQIDCRYCHQTVERSAYAGVPPSDVCMNCHAQVWPRSALLSAVRDSAFSGVPLQWTQVHRLADFVYFDHSIHVNKGVGCVTCHGRVDLMPAVERVVPLTMGWCLDCHRRPELALRPRDKVTSLEWNPPEDRRALGEALVREYRVHTRTDCITCHR